MNNMDVLNLSLFNRSLLTVVGESPTPKDSLPLPLELRQYIFEFLSPVDLARCSLVNRDFRELAKDPILWDKMDFKRFYQGYNVLDEEAWRSALGSNTYGLDLTGAPILDKRALAKDVVKMSNLVEVGATLIKIPKETTLNKLLLMARDFGVPLRYISDEVIAEFGDISVEETQLGLISNSVLPNSRSLSVVNQKKLCATHGYEMPDVVTVTALLVLTYIKSQQLQTRLYHDQPLTYTRCEEKLDGKWNLVVGGFAPSGLRVDHYDYAYEFLGVAGWRKF